MSENTQAMVKKDIGTQVIDRVSTLCDAGFTMPKDFNYVNAIKSSMLALAEVQDRNKKPALEVCTPASVQTALFEMCTKGLDVSKKTAYFIVRGNKLCLHVSYFGHILMVKRLFPNWSPVAHTIREGDVFEYAIDPETGKMKLTKHEQKLANLDNDFIGAYMYLPCSDGTQELYVMTRKQIMKAWSKSSSQSLQTHKDFDEKMALKTIINSGCTKIINATPDPTSTPLDDDDPNVVNNATPENEEEFSLFEEVSPDNTGGTPLDEPPAEQSIEQQTNTETAKEYDF